MQHKSIFHDFKETNLNSKYYDHLNILKGQIEKFQKQQQLRVLEIIYENNEDKLTQNKNGIFINLSNLDLSVIRKIGDYTAYVVKQENELKERDNKINEIASSLCDTT